MHAKIIVKKCMKAKVLATLSLIIIGLVSHASLAAEYSLENSLKVSAYHNDNIQLVPVNGKSLHGRTVRPAMVAKVAGDTWDAALDVDLSFNNFNRSEYDSDDQDVTVAARKQTERHTFSIDVNAVRDSTRTSEQDTSGIVTNSAVRRENYSVSPRWNYLLSDRNSISINGSVTEAEYKSERFTDYDYDSVILSWNHTLEENLQLTLQLTGTMYEPDERISIVFGFFEVGSKTESTSYGAQLGGEYSISENWSINSLVGSTYTDQEYIIRDPQGVCTNPFLVDQGLTPGICNIEDFSGNNLTADVSTNWANENFEMSLGYSIRNQPSSQGYEIEYERFTALMRYRINQKNSINLDFTYGINDALDNSVADVDPRNSNRDFSNAKFAYEYRLAEEWRLKTSYGYKWQDRETNISDADSHSIQIGISYQPTMSMWSR